jgi:hypothetical protein
LSKFASCQNVLSACTFRIARQAMLQPKSAYLKCSYLFKESKACRILSVKFPWVVLLVGGAAGCGGGVPRKLNQTNQIFELNQIKPNQFKCLICLIDGHTGLDNIYYSMVLFSTQQGTPKRGLTVMTIHHNQDQLRFVIPYISIVITTSNFTIQVRRF